MSKLDIPGYRGIISKVSHIGTELNSILSESGRYTVRRTSLGTYRKTITAKIKTD